MDIIRGNIRLRHSWQAILKKSEKIIQGFLAGVTGKVVPAISLYNFSQYTLPKMGEPAMREPSGGLQPPARPARNAYIQMENKSGKIKEVKLWVNTRIRAAVTTVKKRC
ncbi:MAG: hypothetical protein ENTB_03495 [Enterocloster aldenensis]